MKFSRRKNVSVISVLSAWQKNLCASVPSVVEKNIAHSYSIFWFFITNFPKQRKKLHGKVFRINGKVLRLHGKAFRINGKPLHEVLYPSLMCFVWKADDFCSEKYFFCVCLRFQREIISTNFSSEKSVSSDESRRSRCFLCHAEIAEITEIIRVYLCNLWF